MHKNANNQNEHTGQSVIVYLLFTSFAGGYDCRCWWFSSQVVVLVDGVLDNCILFFGLYRDGLCLSIAVHAHQQCRHKTNLLCCRCSVC